MKRRPLVGVEAPAVAKAAATDDQPKLLLRLAHGCGDIGYGGSVSQLAMTNYAEVVQLRLAQYFLSVDPGRCVCLSISIALAPDNQQFIEIDAHPSDTEPEFLKQIVERVRQVKQPVIQGAPIAFAIVAFLKQHVEPNVQLRMFPSLSKTTKAVGLAEAVSRRFAKQQLDDARARHGGSDSSGVASLKRLTNLPNWLAICSWLMNHGFNNARADPTTSGLT